MSLDSIEDRLRRKGAMQVQCWPVIFKRLCDAYYQCLNNREQPRQMSRTAD